MIGTGEFDGIVQRSGVMKSRRRADRTRRHAAPDDILSADADFLDALTDVDRLLCNTGRSRRNTNILSQLPD